MTARHSPRSRRFFFLRAVFSFMHRRMASLGPTYPFVNVCRLADASGHTISRPVRAAQLR
jgi:hypothetical protein